MKRLKVTKAAKIKEAAASRLSGSKSAQEKNADPGWNWQKLLSPERRSEGIAGQDRKKNIGTKISDHRTHHERDFDRVVFSAPVRRLKDKTQVFPLDMHDGVRTRLTHSMEVSNLARSMGLAVASRIDDLAAVKESGRAVPALLAAIALAHDLGNPPFGHQGEEAMRDWVRANQAKIKAQSVEGPFDQKLFRDFLQFEGNAQGFRIISRLQFQGFKSGLRLTASTLSAFMKYPWGSDAVHGGRPVKKYGYFQSEKDVFEWCTNAVGLQGVARHPLSYLMEVCDDIAYSVLDVEDAVKKGLVSVPELASFLGSSQKYKSDRRVLDLLGQYNEDKDWLSQIRFHARAGENIPLASKEIRESLVDLLRSYAIGLMVSDAIECFIEVCKDQSRASLSEGIAKSFRSAVLMAGFKEFASLRIYKHPEVLRAELDGHRVIPALMTAFWDAVCAYCRGNASKRHEYVLSLMSPNYLRVFWQSSGLGLPMWYRQVQLVCDQVCGMTDSFALRTYEEFRSLDIV